MGKLYFIGAGPGDPELITVKGQRLIAEADVIIYAGSLVNPEILKYGRKDAEIYNSATMNLDEVLKVEIEALKAGKMVARVHTGDPAIYGAIQEQMDGLRAAGIKEDQFCVVPGVSSFLATAAALKQEYTLPSISQTVIITRIPAAAGPRSRPGPRTSRRSCTRSFGRNAAPPGPEARRTEARRQPRHRNPRPQGCARSHRPQARRLPRDLQPHPPGQGFQHL